MGYDTTLKQINKLDSIATLQTSPKIISEPSQIPEEFVINGIRVTGNKNYTYGYIIEKLQIHLGKKISFDKFYRGIDRLSATDNFTNIQHKIFLTTDGKLCNITVNVTENPIKTYFQLGLHYDDLYKTGVLLNVTSKHLLFDNDFISADVVVGEKPRYNITYFVDNGFRLSVGLNTSLQQFDFSTDFIPTNTTLTPSINFTNLDFLSISNRIFLQAVYKDNFAVGVGMNHNYVNISSKNSLLTEGDDNVNYEKTNYLNACGFLKYDTFDDKTFPKTGLLFEAKASWYVYASDFQKKFIPFLQGKVKFGYAHTIGNKFTTQIDSEAGISFENNENPYLDFHLGGSNSNFTSNFTSFHGYPFASIGNNSYLKTTLTLHHEIMKNHFVSGIANFSRAEKNVRPSSDENFATAAALIRSTRRG